MNIIKCPVTTEDGSSIARHLDIQNTNYYICSKKQVLKKGELDINCTYNVTNRHSKICTFFLKIRCFDTNRYDYMHF